MKIIMSEPLSDQIDTAIAAMNEIPTGDRTPSDAPFVEILGFLRTFALAMESAKRSPDDRLALVRASLAGRRLYRSLSEEPHRTAQVIDLATWNGREGRA
jgi:hypothetical protein